VTEAQKKERLGIDGFATGKIGTVIRLLGGNFKAFMSALGQKQTEGVNNPSQQTHNSSLTLRLSHTRRSILLTHGQSMSVMGDRFVLIRSNSTTGRGKAGRQAVSQLAAASE
jgi:hypothetical protein